MKITSLVLVAAAALALTACGGGEKATNTANSATDVNYSSDFGNVSDLEAGTNSLGGNGLEGTGNSAALGNGSSDTGAAGGNASATGNSLGNSSTGNSQ